MALTKEDLTVHAGNTEQSQISDIFLAFRSFTAGRATFSVGYPGLPNEQHVFTVGDALLHQSPEHGIFEVRALTVASNLARFRITQISPRLGMIGALTLDSDVNTRFSDDEVRKIGDSLHKALNTIKQSNELSVEQTKLISKSFEELKNSSERLGRKDWLLVVAGTITGEIASLALSSDQAKVLLRALSSSLSWAFENARLLEHIVGS